MEMSDDQRVAAARRTALSYAYVQQAWNDATNGENFPAWVKGPGRQIVLEQLQRLSKCDKNPEEAQSRIKDKMEEMSAQERAEDSYGIFVAFVAELVTECFKAEGFDKLGAEFPLGEEGETSLSTFATVTMDECGVLWQGAFPFRRTGADAGVCPLEYGRRSPSKTF